VVDHERVVIPVRVSKQQGRGVQTRAHLGLLIAAVHFTLAHICESQNFDLDVGANFRSRQEGELFAPAGFVGPELVEVAREGVEARDEAVVKDAGREPALLLTGTMSDN
jgi:hypothetical protein